MWCSHGKAMLKADMRERDPKLWSVSINDPLRHSTGCTMTHCRGFVSVETRDSRDPLLVCKFLGSDPAFGILLINVPLSLPSFVSITSTTPTLYNVCHWSFHFSRPSTICCELYPLLCLKPLLIVFSSPADVVGLETFVNLHYLQMPDQILAQTTSPRLVAEKSMFLFTMGRSLLMYCNPC